MCLHKGNNGAFGFLWRKQNLPWKYLSFGTGSPDVVPKALRLIYGLLTCEHTAGSSAQGRKFVDCAVVVWLKIHRQKSLDPL